jgi:DNA-binding winged helix-turn-helix (wHTH) protein
MICPNCGFIHADSGFADDISTLALPKLQGRLLTRLIAARGGFVSKERLIDACYADRHDGGPDKAELCVFTNICHLRRNLAGRPWWIECQTGRGYRLVRVPAPGVAP